MNWLNAPSIEKWCFEETLRMNERGIPVDIPLAKQTIKFLEKYNKKRADECKYITDGVAPTQVGKLLEWVNNEGLGLKDLQRMTIERALKEYKLDPQVAEVLKIRLEQGRVSTKKLYKMIQMDSGDGVIRGSFIYHGAGTGRFTARRLQVHNFQRPTIKNVDHVIKLLEKGEFDIIVEEFGDRTLEAVGSCMRGFLKAPEGWSLVRADYSAIEARVLAWLARQDDAVKLFHQGEDIYCHMAGYIFKIDPAVIRKGHVDGVLKYSDMRKLGKDTVRGCGYNMGVATFMGQMERKGEDNINGVPIRKDPNMRGQRDKSSFNPKAWQQASSAVYGYRDKYERIPLLWKNTEKAARKAIQSKGKVTRVNGGLIKFKYVDESLVMKLPSGRTIYYPHAEVYSRKNKYTGEDETAIRFRTVLASGKWVWEISYGGKLVENAVQAISRDLMVYGMYNAARKGFKLIGTVHDEIISLFCNRYITKDTIGMFENLICKLPKWAKGESLESTVPLAAEGVISERFGK